MELRIINPAEVIDLLPMAECIEVVDKAMRCASQGDAQMPLRKMLELPGENNLFGWMPGSMTEPDVFGTKLVSVFPGNFDLGMHSHHGIVALFESERGRPYAIVDASEITAIRTAAASALATRLLAREDSKTLAIMGYGAQARQHVESMLCVRDFDDIRVWGRNLEKSQAFAEDMGAKFGVEIQALENARAAVAEADVICTVTASREPVLFGDWLEPGQHINAVGTSYPGARELDTAAVQRARMFVDLCEGAIAQAGMHIPELQSTWYTGTRHFEGFLGTFN